MDPIRFVFPHDSAPALAVFSNPADFRNLKRLFAHSGLELRGAADLAAALPQLDGLSIVLCDESLPDGNWEQIAQAACRLETPPSIVVAPRYANEQLWSEVLNRGAFDLLPRPFRTCDLHRVVVGGWRAWHSRLNGLLVAGAA